MEARFPTRTEAELERAVRAPAVEIDHLFEVVVENRLIPVGHLAGSRMDSDMPDRQAAIRHHGWVAGIEAPARYPLELAVLDCRRTGSKSLEGGDALLQHILSN